MYLPAVITLFLMTCAKAGATVWPVVSFIPDWTKIFIGESVTMTCDVESATQKEMVYNWYKNNDWVHTGRNYTIQKAQYSDTGHYHCQTNTSERSDSASLNVYNSYVILQAPLSVFEGDNVTLRCHHHPSYAAKQTIFYKDRDIIQDLGSKSELLIENADMKSVCKYKCGKKVMHHLLYYLHTDEVTFSVQELFTPPVLHVTEGDNNMTLTCNTSLSLLRKTTELEFAFYKDRHNIRKFNPSNRLIVPSALLKDSGTYMCQVRTSVNRVEKTSLTLYIEAKRKEQFDPPEITVAPYPVTKDTSSSISLIPLSLAVILLVFAVVVSFPRRKHNEHQLLTDPQKTFSDSHGEEIALENDVLLEPF